MNDFSDNAASRFFRFKRVHKTAAVLFCILIAATGVRAQSSATVEVYLNHRIGPFSPIYRWFGYDESNYTTTRNGQQLLHKLHDLTPAPVYIRSHFLLASGNGTPELKWSSSNVYTEDENGNAVYNWTILDGIFDAYAAAHVRPMVELGFMPKALSSHPDPYHIPWPAKPGDVEGWSFPPKSYRRWQQLIYQLAKHMVQRYGAETVSTWYWEVWNEPDIFYWHGTEQEYERLYDHAVAGVRQAIPNANVGGPATTGPGSSGKAAEFLREFLRHCAQDKSTATSGHIPLDFISFHVKGTTKVVNGHVQMGLDHELKNAANGFSIVREFPMFKRLPVILSEADPEGCAACVSTSYPQNAYRNGSQYPAYTAASMMSLLDLAQREHVNLIGMLTWAFEFEDQPYFVGFRTLSTHGIDKPELNFFRMAGLMGGSQVAASSSGAASRDGIPGSGVGSRAEIDALATADGNTASVMIWNYHDEDVPGPAAAVHIKIHGLPPPARRILLQQYRIDNRHSNAYTAWLQMGSPPQPTAEQYARLQAAGALQLLDSPQWMTPASGNFQTEISLPRQGISLLRISWATK
ncbi:MAG TPA: beta-xylosidase [Acidobacteriaceae bacterium]|nr:beta-xylosidase [Acidobacteriaceae bacterium]